MEKKDIGRRIKEQVADKANGAIEFANDKKNAAAQVIHNTKNDIDVKRFGPIDEETFLSSSFTTPNIVRVLEKNVYADKETCINAVGFLRKIAHSDVLELVKTGYPQNKKISFLPSFTESVYYLNPYVPREYISLDEYFDFIKKARVNELENVAYKLGAKYVKIIFKEEKKSFVSVEGNAKKKNKVGIGRNKQEDKLSAEAKGSVKDYKILSVASEMEFNGHNNPERPELIYYKNDNDIESLVEMCIDGTNPPKSKTYTLNYSRASDINLKVAAEIDAVLAKLSMQASASVKSEIENENKLFLEYQIKF